MAVLRAAQGGDRELSRGPGRGARRRQQPRGPRAPARARCRSRASSTSSTTTSARTRRRSSSASRPAARCGCATPTSSRATSVVKDARRRGRRAALHLRPRDARRRRARRPQGEGHDPLGVGAARASPPRCGSTTTCSRSPIPDDVPEGERLHRQPEPERRSRSSTRASSSRRSRDAPPGSRFQFERLGYFCVDPRLAARRSRSSTAPSRCATPGRRSSKARGRKEALARAIHEASSETSRMAADAAICDREDRRRPLCRSSRTRREQSAADAASRDVAAEAHE